MTAEKNDLRICIGSDIHCTDLMEWYGVSYQKRMQHWVDSLLAEHAKTPFDLVVINGDISLDYWINGGSVLTKGKGTAKIFVDQYLTQLPAELPVFVMPGNHEQYSDEAWFALTGNHRHGFKVLKDTLLLFMDNYDGILDSVYHHDGVYTLTDLAYIEKIMSLYPDKDVYIIFHYIDTAAESAAFKELVASNDRIKGMFSGHTHQSRILELGAEWGNKTIAQTGNFAFFIDSAIESFWGFRELVITEASAYSQYIIVESDAVIDDQTRHFERATRNFVCYYGKTTAIEH